MHGATIKTRVVCCYLKSQIKKYNDIFFLKKTTFEKMCGRISEDGK